MSTALARDDRDWDLARNVLSKMSLLGSEQLYPLLELLSQNLQKQAESSGQLAQVQVRNTVTMVWFFSVLIVFISGLVAVVFIRYIKNAAIRRRLAKFVENNPHAVLSIDLKGRVIYHNQASTDMIEQYFPLGVVDDLLPKDIFRRISKLRDSKESNWEWEYDWHGLHLLGSLSLVDELSQYDFHIRDITARREAEFKLNHLAFHDDLTDLPNRRLLGEKLIAVSDEPECAALLMLIRPDRFQLVTSSSGYEFGDLLIVQTAKRILSALQKSVIDIHLFRLDAAQFALLGCFSDEVLAESHAEKVDEILREAFARPIGVNEQQIFLTMSIGSVIRHSSLAQPEAMIRDADAALRVSILKGGDCFVHFCEEMAEQANSSLALESALRQTLGSSELSLYYQPQYQTNKQQLVGFEALIRWHSDKLGFVSPAEFIPVAESTGLIVPLGQWIFHQACQQAALWFAAGYRGFKIAVNISSRQLLHNRFMDTVKHTLAETAIDPKLIELEITESAFMDNVEYCIETMYQLRELGLSLAIDDFGTGYSSLTYLKRFPLSKLKIDQSFIHNLTDEPKDEAIVRNIIDLAKNLELRVIAEGVETEEQRSLLETLGCDEIQGYLMSKPKPAIDAEQSFISNPQNCESRHA